MGSLLLLLGPDIGFGASSAFCVSGREGETRWDSVVLRILAWLSRVIYIGANHTDSIDRLMRGPGSGPR